MPVASRSSRDRISPLVPGLSGTRSLPATPHPAHPDVSGTVTIQLATIVGIPVGLTLADILDPDGLQDNGGPTKTIALTDSPTNPARHKGDAATCVAAPVNGLDQRGLPRTPPCDIGTYELQP